MSTAATTKADLILWDVVQEHLDEAEFLYEKWDERLQAAHYRLDELGARLEARLEAHLDGLLVGGSPVATRLLQPLLESAADQRLATLATLVLLRSDEKHERYAPFGALTEVEGELRDGIARGLVLSEQPGIERELFSQFRYAKDSEAKAAFLEILTDRHVDAGEELRQCLETDSRALRAAALRAAGCSGRRDQSILVEHFLDLSDPLLRDAAVEAGLVLGIRDAWRLCCKLAALEEPSSTPRAMMLVALMGGRREHAAILEPQLGRPKTREAALWALGFTGSVRAADLALPFLHAGDERLSKLAAEVIASIAGFDLFESALREPPDESAEAQAAEERAALPPLEEDDLDADLVPDGVDNLPLLHPLAVEQRWRQRRPELEETRRYLFGDEYEPKTLVKALSDAPMRRRHAHALELMIRSGGRRQVATRAFASKQREHLAALSQIQDQELANSVVGAW